jgi:formylglycine-generating enzyme required for sulfatase activity
VGLAKKNLFLLVLTPTNHYTIEKFIEMGFFREAEKTCISLVTNTIIWRGKKMQRVRLAICLVVVCVMAVANTASADTFGSGTVNEFTIDFVPISGSTNPVSGYGIVNNNYRMGTYEISNDQWNKFTAAYGAVAGNPWYAYHTNRHFTGESVPINIVSWYEAAQFVNYLNTSTNHTAAYKFTGTQGTSDYTFGVWQSGDVGYSASNPYRNSNAYYFLPTENEWVKAAYWNGTNIQTYATIGDTTPTQAGWNYVYNNRYATNLGGPWAATSGSQELNGTHNMMGNVFEWLESRYSNGGYSSGFHPGLRGGAWGFEDDYLASSSPSDSRPYGESGDVVGFRVASVPEPLSVALLLAGGLALLRRKR